MTMLERTKGIQHSSIWEAPVMVSDAMREVASHARDVAGTDTTVLILGESGTGKELVARFIHACSMRVQGPFVLLSCSGGAHERWEQNLLGAHAEEGSSVSRGFGAFADARGGTLVLDEVAELPLTVQATLVRALQERSMHQPAGEAVLPIDVRLVATSRHNLRDLVASGRFRPDLYHRLCVYPITIAPLRERTADIGALAAHFVQRLSADMGRQAPVLSPEALAVLGGQPYVGNVRELRNVIERSLIRCRAPVLQAKDILLDPPLRQRSSMSPALESDAEVSDWALPIDLGELERLAIREALRRVGGNRTHAARLLGISLRTLRNKLRTWRQTDRLAPGDEGEASVAARQEHDTGLAQSSQSTSEEQAA